jgi:TRAP-type C4-dicarboxylate transport system permease small subunit
MGLQRVFGILFLVVGALGLAYGGFTYTKETHKASIGSLQLSVDEKKTVNIPLSVGIGFLVVGGLLLLIPRKQ